jgi:WD40 repeat protein
VRNLSEAVHVLKGNIGAIRSTRFTSDGRFLSMAEAADFVHIFDVQSNYNKRQELDLFGEISGMSFSPDTEAFYIGVADQTYGGLMEFSRRHQHHYLNCLW